MKTLGFGRHVLGIGLGLIMLAGCGGSQAGGPGSVAGVAQARGGTRFRVERRPAVCQQPLLHRRYSLSAGNLVRRITDEGFSRWSVFRFRRQRLCC